MTKSTRRVLVVEDRPRLRGDFARNIEKLGVRVFAAGTRDEAMDICRSYSFHAALIDIMLSEEPSDRGGLDIINYINSTKEGTKCVVISGYKYADAPVSAMGLGVSSYLIKREIRTAQDYVQPIADALKAVKINCFGRHRTFSSYFAGAEDIELWEAMALDALKVEARLFYGALDELFSEYLPVLPLLDAKQRVNIHRTRHLIDGTLWSRAAGQPIYFALYNHRLAPDQSLPGVGGLSARRRGDLSLLAARDENFQRDDFAEKTLDV